MDTFSSKTFAGKTFASGSFSTPATPSGGFNKFQPGCCCGGSPTLCGLPIACAGGTPPTTFTLTLTDDFISLLQSCLFYGVAPTNPVTFVNLNSPGSDECALGPLSYFAAEYGVAGTGWNFVFYLCFTTDTAKLLMGAGCCAGTSLGYQFWMGWTAPWDGNCINPTLDWTLDVCCFCSIPDGCAPPCCDISAIPGTQTLVCTTICGDAETLPSPAPGTLLGIYDFACAGCCASIARTIAWDWDTSSMDSSVATGACIPACPPPTGEFHLSASDTSSSCTWAYDTIYGGQPLNFSVQIQNSGGNCYLTAFASGGTTENCWTWNSSAVVLGPAPNCPSGLYTFNLAAGTNFCGGSLPLTVTVTF